MAQHKTAHHHSPLDLSQPDSEASDMGLGCPSLQHVVCCLLSMNLIACVVMFHTLLPYRQEYCNQKPPPLFRISAAAPGTPRGYLLRCRKPRRFVANFSRRQPHDLRNLTMKLNLRDSSLAATPSPDYHSSVYEELSPDAAALDRQLCSPGATPCLPHPHSTHLAWLKSILNCRMKQRHPYPRPLDKG